MKRGRNQRRRQGGMNVNRALDSNGPDVRIRGTASQIYEKYQTLARDAASAGDRVKVENYLQHAEHYYRVIRAMQPAQAPQPDQGGEGDYEGEQPSLGEFAERRAFPENGHGGEGGDPPSAEAEPAQGDFRSDQPRANGPDAHRGEREGYRDPAREGGRDGDDRRHGRRRRRPHRGERRDGQPGGAEAADGESAETAEADEAPV